MTTYEKNLFETVHWSRKIDFDAFEAMTDFLPKRNQTTPYHSGPHSLARFKMMYDLLRPQRVVEIGFNLGHSAVIWLELGVKKVVSIQPSTGPKTAKAVHAIMQRFPERFCYAQTDSVAWKEIDPAPDLLFVDGCHDYDWVCRDIELGLRSGVRNFFMDDYDSHHGPGVIQAVHDKKLVVKALFGTMAWCTTRDGLCLRHDPEAYEP